jgi:hypothetical protein
MVNITANIIKKVILILIDNIFSKVILEPNSMIPRYKIFLLEKFIPFSHFLSSDRKFRDIPIKIAINIAGTS